LDPLYLFVAINFVSQKKTVILQDN